MLLHYKNLGIVLCIVRRARDMLNSADLQDQQNRRFSHREPFSNYFLVGMLACRSLVCHGAAPPGRSTSRPSPLPHAPSWCLAASPLAVAGEQHSQRSAGGNTENQHLSTSHLPHVTRDAHSHPAGTSWGCPPGCWAEPSPGAGRRR